MKPDHHAKVPLLKSYEISMGSPQRYIDSEASFQDLVAQVGSAGRIGVDMEADSFHHYREKVCLIQLGFGEHNVVVDPLVGFDPAPLLSAMVQKPLVFHGVDYDLRMFHAQFHFVPEMPVFDTMIAAQLLGYSEIGLAALVLRFFGVRLSKRSQRADWSRRPLSPDLIEYASNDTRYLLPLAEQLASELASKGRLAWHEESCAAAVAAAMMPPARKDEERWRVKGAHGLSRRELAFLRELWRWREREACRADRPRFKIMIDEQLLLLAQRAARDPDVLGSGKLRLPRDCTGSRWTALQKAMDRADALPEGRWPEKRKPTRGRRAPDCSSAIERLREACAQTARNFGIAPAIIAPRAALAAIAQKCPRTIEETMVAGGLLRWQAELLFAKLAES